MKEQHNKFGELDKWLRAREVRYPGDAFTDSVMSQIDSEKRAPRDFSWGIWLALGVLVSGACVAIFVWPDLYDAIMNPFGNVVSPLFGSVKLAGEFSVISPWLIGGILVILMLISLDKIVVRIIHSI